VVDWNGIDLSLTVQATTTLFDGDEIDASVSQSINVPKDTKLVFKDGLLKSSGELYSDWGHFGYSFNNLRAP
jgi:hypothetical protein